MEQEMRELRERLKNFSNSIIAEQACIFGELLQTDEINQCILADEFIMVYDILRDECVRRICMLAEAEN